MTKFRLFCIWGENSLMIFRVFNIFEIQILAPNFQTNHNDKRWIGGDLMWCLNDLGFHCYFDLWVPRSFVILSIIKVVDRWRLIASHSSAVIATRWWWSRALFNGRNITGIFFIVYNVEFLVFPNDCNWNVLYSNKYKKKNKRINNKINAASEDNDWVTEISDTFLQFCMGFGRFWQKVDSNYFCTLNCLCLASYWLSVCLFSI